MSAYIIAEIGPNHNGSITIAKKMIKKLANSGANAIKFQLAIPEAVYSSDAFKAEYQKINDNSKSVIEMSKKLQLSQSQHIELKAECDFYGLEYLCTAFDLTSLKFLDQILNVPRFKIASGELLSIDMLEYIADVKKPVFVSTGMADIDEIQTSIDILKSKGLLDITILHCVSKYPALNKDLNLNMIPKLKDLFNLSVGYSDHSIGPEASFAAISLGASVIEKHVTLNRNMSGPDHKASSTISHFANMVESIRKIELCFGSDNKIFSSEEVAIKNMARKSIVSARDLPIGTVIQLSDITYKRPGLGFNPTQRDLILGKEVIQFIPSNHVIYPYHIR